MTIAPCNAVSCRQLARSASILTALLVAGAGLAGSCIAATSPTAALIAQAGEPQTARPIPYDSVAEAYDAVRTRSGAAMVVREDGWTVISFSNSEVWTFVPKGDEAYPAVVKRSLRNGPNGETFIDMAVLCTGDQNACARLVHRYEAENRQNVQQIQPDLPPPR